MGAFDGDRINDGQITSQVSFSHVKSVRVQTPVV